ncbi:MAG: B12-binding domain-containing radical SAM protein [Oligoflexia bacterium]|nr:B12-binding domain-containing radical SAM protein [Oligoflexia bacterium]
MKIQVTLVAPPINYQTSLYGFKHHFSKKNKYHRNQPPLGIGYIASYLIKHQYNVSLIDCAAHSWNMQQSVDAILATKPNIIGITAITFESEAAYSLIRELKKKNHNIFLVLGGAHVNSNYPKIHIECPEVDAFVAGDGEMTMLEISQILEKGIDRDGKLAEGTIEKLANLRGVRIRKNDGIFTTLIERELLDDLDQLPSPAYHLYHHHLYKPLPHRAKRLPSTSMITSRGCSYGLCTYCELSGLIKKSYRRHSVDRVIDEIILLKKITFAKEIYFQDDIFVSDTKWVEDFCNQLISKNVSISWSCESRFKGISFELLSLMKKAGLWRIYYGLESGSQHLLDKIKKGHTLEEAAEAVNIANKVGVDIVGFFMFGLPGETPEDARNTINFSKKLGLDHAIYSFTVPHPNTELYSICKSEGTFFENNYHYRKVSFLPSTYKKSEELQKLRDKAFREFYLRPSYVYRCIKKIRSIGDLSYYFRGLNSLLGYI